jgi:uncharacterized protein YcfL
MVRLLAVVSLLALAACSAPTPQIVSGNAQSVTVVATSGFGTGFASEQEVRVAAQRACEAFGRNAGVATQVTANDSRRTVQFTCVER